MKISPLLASAASCADHPVLSGCSKLRSFGNRDQTRAGRGRTKQTSFGARGGDAQRQTCHQQQEIVKKYRDRLANQDCQYLMGLAMSNVLGGIVAQEADFTVISPNSSWYFSCERWYQKPSTGLKDWANEERIK